MDKFLYYVVYYLIRLAGLLPLRILYLIADILFFLIYRIARYRKSIVLDNMRNSFPEKPPGEINLLARRYYRHLADLIVETIYQPSMGEDEIRQRVRYNNPEIIQRYFDQGKHVAAVMGHCGNWEWLCGFPLVTSYKCITVYRPVKNRIVERLLFEMRSRFGAELVPMKMAIKRIYQYADTGVPTITAFIADQAPPREKAHWVEFLNQDTPVYLGIERLARKLNMAVVYFKMKKVRRGYYEFDFIPVCDNAVETPEFEITSAHVARLEEQIREQPAYWLWSHRRWKVKRINLPQTGVEK